MSNTTYDLIIIGAGPGGYVAAERAGARGMKVLLVEKGHLGGVCLNEGCIPSKTLLHSAKLFVQACSSQAYGVTVDNPRFDLAAAMARKRKVVQALRDGVAFQMKRYKVEVLQGEASFVDRRTVQVNGDTYRAENVIIATGSSPLIPPISGVDQAHVLTSSQILEREELPESLAIIGGGAIGCEFASFFASVGVKVSVVEMLPEIVPTLDPELAAMLRRAMAEVSFHVGCTVTSIGPDSVTYEQGGRSHTIPADLVLMSTGRAPNLAGLELDRIGVDYGRQGIVVDGTMRTNVPGIYAVGDVTGLSMLAHSASRMGEVAVRNMVGERDAMRYRAVPWVVYTMPEVAWVGLTEAQAQEQGIAVKSARLPMTANGRFLAENEGKRGLCKVVVDARTGALLGVQMIGATCSEIIYGAAAMIEDEFRVQDIQDIIFPHPTVAEILRDTLYGLPGV